MRVSILLLVIVIFSCSEQSGFIQDSEQVAQNIGRASTEQIEELITAFVTAKDHDVINIPAGFYELETQLILDNVKDVAIKGAGMDKTVLSFKNLKSGGEGMRIRGNSIVLEDFSVFDAPGDGIKTQHCDTIVFRRVNATWTNGDKSKNGTYAIYPVQCKQVLIEECEASHSRDAGIYVGQSDHIVVRNCKAFGNVAGIEIENCDHSEVYNNIAENNSAGILVFNLPGLPKSYGSYHKVYNNKIIGNNHKNFAVAINETNNGNTVTQVPPGSGIILLAADNVEIFDNEILDNKTVGISIANYQITSFPFEVTDDGWSPFSSNISIHNNTFEKSALPPDMSKDLGKLIAVKNAHGIGKTQDIIYDGFFDASKGSTIQENPMKICINEEEINDLRFTLFDIKSADEIDASDDASPFVCSSHVNTEVDFIKSYK